MDIAATTHPENVTMQPVEEIDEDDDGETIDQLERRLIARRKQQVVEAIEPRVTASAAASSPSVPRYDASSGKWTLGSTPSSAEEWKQACFERWEDIDTFVDDPFFKQRFRDVAALESIDWEQLYRWMDINEASLLSSRVSYVAVQRLVRETASHEKIQDFTENFVVGCTRRFAVIAAKIELGGSAKDTFHLYTLAIDSPEPPKCETVRRKQAPADMVHNLQVEKDVNAIAEVSLESVSPAWRQVNNSALPGPPISAAVDPISGTVALLCEKALDRLIVFNVHAPEDAVRLANVKLPCDQPDIVAINADYVAAAYFAAEGRLQPEAPPVPLPPHVQVRRAGRPEWRAYAVRAKSERLSLANPQTAEQRQQLHKFSSLSFHRSKPHYLVIGTDDGGIRMLNCETLFASGFNEPQCEDRPTFYPGPNLQQLYDEYRKVAEKQEDENKAASILSDMPAPRQQVWSATWTDVGPEHCREPRVTMCLAESIAMVNCSELRAKYKLETLGKKPVFFNHRGGPTLSFEARGGVIVVHDATTSELFIGEQERCLPKWKFDHPDVVGKMPGYARPYPSVAVMSRRIVVLWPNGFVGFVEIASDEMLEKFRQEEEKLVADRLSKLKVSTDTSQSAVVEAQRAVSTPFKAPDGAV